MFWNDRAILRCPFPSDVWSVGEVPSEELEELVSLCQTVYTHNMHAGLATPEALESNRVAIATTFSEVDKITKDGWTVVEPILREVRLVCALVASQTTHLTLTGHRSQDIDTKACIACFLVADPLLILSLFVVTSPFAGRPLSHARARSLREAAQPQQIRAPMLSCDRDGPWLGLSLRSLT